MRHLVAVIASALLLSACAATIPPVEVTRFHLGEAPSAASAAIEPLGSSDPQSLEFRTYAAAVSRQLARLGYGEAAAASPYIAAIAITRDTRAALRRRSPVTIGVGGGTGGYGGGIGIGASFGLGGNKARETVIVELSVRLIARKDRSTLWEGRARTEAPANAPGAQPGLAADALAVALFRDFPGVSGQTVTIR